MKNVTYRTLNKEDYPQVENLICSSFGLDGYISDSKALDIIKKRYLRGCLAVHTYNQVAVVDGQVVGIIIGASRHDKRTSFNRINALYTLFYTLQLVLFHLKACTGQGNVHIAYGNLIRGRKKQYDGVMILFIVQKNMQGLGIGKELLKSLQKYWKSEGTHRSYLYTDDTCNYGFYEHMGLTRAAETSIDILRNGEKVNMDVYLYEYQEASFPTEN